MVRSPAKWGVSNHEAAASAIVRQSNWNMRKAFETERAE